MTIIHSIRMTFDYTFIKDLLGLEDAFSPDQVDRIVRNFMASSITENMVNEKIPQETKQYLTVERTHPDYGKEITNID